MTRRVPTLRETLPERRASVVVDTVLRTHPAPAYPCAIGVGHFADGRHAEIFVHSEIKSGVELEAVLRDAAVLASIALQYGATIETLCHSLTRDDAGRPASLIGGLIEAAAEVKLAGD